MNVVALTGNLATDVDLRQVGEDKQVANFVLAVDRASANGDADFFRICAWNKQAELCSRYLVKGRHVGVEGRLRSDSWEDAEGNRRRSVEVVAHKVDFYGPRPEQTPSADIPFEAAVA